MFCTSAFDYKSSLKNPNYPKNSERKSPYCIWSTVLVCHANVLCIIPHAVHYRQPVY